MSSFSGFNYRPQGDGEPRYAMLGSGDNQAPYNQREPSSGGDFNHPPLDYGETGGEPRYASDQDYREPKYAINVKNMISVLTVLLIVVLIIYFLHVYASRFARFARRRSEARRRRFHFRGEEPARLRNVGLDSAVLETLPIFLYKSQNFRDCLECAICLCEFEENEKARLLPNCRHIFHVDCIDMWFWSHSTCPICRTGVQPEKPALESVRRAGLGYNTRANSFQYP